MPHEAQNIKNLFATLCPAKSCTSCMQQTTAFAVKVCRLGKPKPDEGKDCDFWRKWKA
ncbi:hypothetical protein [Propionivibrio sp.]|uniref:hypothetical protein n=1 Tax=Propionivibrio sp. TaxID=2212460 RepID=UPI003BEF855A